MEQVKIYTEDVIADTSEVLAEVEEDTTCGELLKQLVDTYQLPSGKGAWLLQEEWQGCRHWLALGDAVPREGVVKLHLKLCLRPQAQVPDSVRKYRRKTRQCKLLDEQFLSSPYTFLSDMPTCRQLCCISSCMQRQRDKADRKYSSTLLQRLRARQRLWGPQEPSPFDKLMSRFNTLEEDNLKLSTEVSNLNIQSTRLQRQLRPVSGKAEQLALELGQLQEEVKRRREERARNAPKKVEQVKSELQKLNKELETKNQLNAGLNSKLQKVKDHLKIQRKVLDDKKKEIERLRGWGTDSNATHVELHSSSSDTRVESHSHTGGVATLSRMAIKRSTPSSSRKRHASIIEAKSRQLVEEEGLAFRQQQKAVASQMTTPLPESAPDVLHIPPPDNKWYEGEPATPTKPKGAEFKVKKSVHFDAAAIVLNAALEGELTVLKECIRKLGGCGYSNDKGATCLHNAVCSGNFEAVSYLVDMSCDINAQDIDGWSPLHCAVAYSNLAVMRYLIEHGASLFLCTREGDTPLNIALEEYKLLGEGLSDAENLRTAAECLEYLKEMEGALGVLNGGVVFALFSHTPKEAGELSMTEGERLVVLQQKDDKWWRVKNGRGQTGEVPSTFLGLYRQVKDVL